MKISLERVLLSIKFVKFTKQGAARPMMLKELSDGEQPPADQVPYLMTDLLDWLKHADEHTLTVSCLFHYELEFIHPFADGNGRMGRLW